MVEKDLPLSYVRVYRKCGSYCKVHVDSSGRQEALQQHCKSPQVPPMLNAHKTQTHLNKTGIGFPTKMHLLK